MLTGCLVQVVAYSTLFDWGVLKLGLLKTMSMSNDKKWSKLIVFFGEISYGKHSTSDTQTSFSMLDATLSYRMAFVLLKSDKYFSSYCKNGCQGKYRHFHMW